LEAAIYFLLLLAIVSGMGYWIFRARRAMKAAGKPPGYDSSDDRSTVDST
jgi:hypothetical protein